MIFFTSADLRRSKRRYTRIKNGFSERVYKVVRKIPRGQVVSYKEVARLAGRPRAYRAVGNILNKNPYPKNKVPCHRVIRSDGKIEGYALGSKKKIKLLRAEKAI